MGPSELSIYLAYVRRYGQVNVFASEMLLALWARASGEVLGRRVWVVRAVQAVWRERGRRRQSARWMAAGGARPPFSRALQSRACGVSVRFPSCEASPRRTELN